MIEKIPSSKTILLLIGVLLFLLPKTSCGCVDIYNLNYSYIISGSYPKEFIQIFPENNTLYVIIDNLTLQIDNNTRNNRIIWITVSPIVSKVITNKIETGNISMLNYNCFYSSLQDNKLLWKKFRCEVVKDAYHYTHLKINPGYLEKCIDEDNKCKLKISLKYIVKEIGERYTLDEPLFFGIMKKEGFATQLSLCQDTQKYGVKIIFDKNYLPQYVSPSCELKYEVNPYTNRGEWIVSNCNLGKVTLNILFPYKSYKINFIYALIGALLGSLVSYGIYKTNKKLFYFLTGIIVVFFVLIIGIN